MPAPTLDELGERPFSFYPPIVGIEHNEWVFRQATWSEVLVSNTKTSQQLWVPRRLLGEISKIDEPVMIVGLVRELEFKAGTVWPYERRVLEMPRIVGAPPLKQETGPQPVAPRSSVRQPPSAESRIGRLILLALVAGIVLVFGVVAFFRGGPPRTRVVFTSKDQTFLELSNNDDFHSVMRKLGKPAEDRWRSDTGELQYRLLWYPDRSYFVILMGTERGSERYIGALDKNWHVVHYVDVGRGRSTASMLRALPKF